MLAHAAPVLASQRNRLYPLPCRTQVGLNSSLEAIVRRLAVSVKPRAALALRALRPGMRHESALEIAVCQLRGVGRARVLLRVHAKFEA